MSSARLMGARTVLTGLSPQNAATIAGIGIELGPVETAGDLEDGIARADLLLGRS
jgi:rsbT co-antagonist protein RsbR